MTEPKMHYQCWTANDTASDTCVYDDRLTDQFCVGCARRCNAAPVARPAEETTSA